jgi:hypothetical protein
MFLVNKVSKAERLQLICWKRMQDCKYCALRSCKSDPVKIVDLI